MDECSMRDELLPLIIYLVYWPMELYFVYMVYSFYMRANMGQLDYFGNYMDPL